MSSEGQNDLTGDGLLVVISGPSGVGKSTICRGLVDRLGAELSISATTRTPGKGEQDGKDYYFLSEEEFKKRLGNNEFLEHADHLGISGALTGLCGLRESDALDSRVMREIEQVTL